LEFNVPFQHKYGYIRDEVAMSIVSEKMDAPTNISIADAYKMSADIAQAS